MRRLPLVRMCTRNSVASIHHAKSNESTNTDLQGDLLSSRLWDGLETDALNGTPSYIYTFLFLVLAMERSRNRETDHRITHDSIMQPMFNNLFSHYPASAHPFHLPSTCPQT